MDQAPSVFPQSSPMPAIPIIDMGRLTLTSSKDFEILKLHSACKEWGIFQLVNHRVSSSQLEKLKYEIEEFFRLPLEEKMRYKQRPGDFEGYSTTLSDSVDQTVDWAEKIYMRLNPIQTRKPHLFPELHLTLREILDAYSKETKRVAKTLLKLMGEALKVEKNELEELFGEGSMQSVRMSYYPPCPKPDQVFGLKAHSDASGLTILFQVNGVEGLEVKKEGVWIPVKVLPDAFVVNVGDAVEILSNGVYKSVEHRAVVNSIKERKSIAMFFSPKMEAEIGPAASLINQQNPPLFKRKTMENYVKEFFSHKFNGKSFIEAMKIEKEI